MANTAGFAGEEYDVALGFKPTGDDAIVLSAKALSFSPKVTITLPPLSPDLSFRRPAVKSETDNTATGFMGAMTLR